MDRPESVRQSFLRQARACNDLGSPFTARLCRMAAERLDESTAVGRRLLQWQGDPTSSGDALALRLAGSLHAVVRSGQDPHLAGVYPPHTNLDDDALWAAVDAALRRDETFILAWLRSAPQTNEVRRSAALLPGFLTIAKLFSKPLMLSEVGASAGLNLQWDRYAYRLGDFSWGTTSSVTLTPDWEGPPLPDADLVVSQRAGCDLNPLDPSCSDDRERLAAYIWADQTDRLERTRKALEIAEASGLKIERADAIQWLAERLVQPHEGLVHVIYHSIAWQYFPEDLKARGEALITQAGDRATTDAPLARLQMEADDQADGAALSLQVWPTGERHEIGRADFHGRWIKWKGWPGL
ncbi:MULTISPECIES: DUF2332 domain-containing protein [Alphaproteobacteria]|uniref:DUF2332 domain-containing protein n=2 Tax=Alphaproteobacteria TaxID=28211 RepID=A0A512HKR7_9HYPH|nr:MULTISPECIES: DUF2332 family protein [Alphaproteobacteria]GEO86033.1 hypothetical protein RNA01_29650 [Ciceribacter naphthalenivorans]GLR22120.1 hypothetical protein GCM10007920_19070 [Ciceribacter naphthalenivorans]GLT04976.1 hypothetical protein GCM10007926_19070 [Sphingomonas psychrolutea]